MRRRNSLATWRLFGRAFKDDVVHIGGMKMTFTETNNGSGSEDEGGSKDGYISWDNNSQT
jgi:hypothetical protein